MKKFSVLKFLITAICILSLFACTACKDEPADEPVKKVYYTVSFDSFGGSDVPSQRVESGKTATLPTPPTKEGFTFKAWMYKGAEWSFDSPITSSIRLSATWYDRSIKYRVTVGVETSLANRGTAVIDGVQASSTIFSAGDRVTLRASVNEGFEFKGWIDYETGKVVNTNLIYSFVATEDVTVEASFKYVVSGLDNKHNKALWEAINKTAEEESFRIQLVKTAAEGEAGGTHGTKIYNISVNRPQGLAVIREIADECCNPEAVREIWMVYKDGACKYYTYENGALEEISLPKTEDIMPGIDGIGETEENSFGLDVIAEILFGEGMNEGDKEQLLLAIYTLFKDNLTETSTGFDFSLPMKDFLNGAREMYFENKDNTVHKNLYDSIKPEMDKLIKENDQVIYGDIKLSDMMKTMSLKTMIAMLGMMSGEGRGYLDDFNAKNIESITSVCEYLTDAGINYDKDELLAEYEAIMEESVFTAIERLNVATPGGSKDDIPEGTDIVAAVLYGALENFTFGDIIYMVLDDIGIIGSRFDITNASLDFSDELLNGSMTIEGGVITSLVAAIENDADGSTLIIEFFTDIGEFQFPTAA